jgi:hypothetical protein
VAGRAATVRRRRARRSRRRALFALSASRLRCYGIIEKIDVSSTRAELFCPPANGRGGMVDFATGHTAINAHVAPPSYTLVEGDGNGIKPLRRTHSKSNRP